jgi:hypothetical protein
MSGIGVGSQEMCSVILDNGQLTPLQLILNDLRTTLGYVINYIPIVYLFTCLQGY